jgi:hypothetical protein
MQVRQIGWTRSCSRLPFRYGRIDYCRNYRRPRCPNWVKAPLTERPPLARESGHSTKTVRSKNFQIQTRCPRCDRSQDENADPTLGFLELRRCQLEFAWLLPVTVVRGPFPISFQFLLEDLGSDALASFCKVVERQRTNDCNDVGVDNGQRQHFAGFEFA